MHKIALSKVPQGYILTNNIGIEGIEHVSRYKNLLFHPGGLADSLRGKVLADIKNTGSTYNGQRKVMYWTAGTDSVTATRRSKQQLMTVSKVYLDARIEEWVGEYVSSRPIPVDGIEAQAQTVTVTDSNGAVVGQLWVPSGGEVKIGWS